MCNNTSFERCMKCGRYSVNECHGHRDKPMEEIIICSIGGTKKWERINGEYQYENYNNTYDMKDKVVELINAIGNSLDAPYYASKILTSCGKEILEIVETLEMENKALRQKNELLQRR